MDFFKKYWCNSGTQIQTIRLGRRYTLADQGSSKQNNCKCTKQVWQTIRRKIRKDGKKVFTSSVTFGGMYDPETYEQNFDEGMGWMEPDNLSRSFSARYADPSRISGHNRLLD